MMADKRLTAPVAGDEREQAVLDLVPLAGAGRQVTDAHARTVAATAIGGNQQVAGVRITLAAHELPPATDGIGGESCGVMVDPHAHPSGVVGDIVDAIGHCPSQPGNEEIVNPDLLGRALRPPFPPAVTEVADKLLL